jgi:flagellar protein FliO/FliZ
MLTGLLGADTPPLVKFVLAFLIVLGLIFAAFWAVRRFGAGRMGGGARGRQPRLSVTESIPLDNRRALLLVRRDNIEHLVMIGGTTDVVVEANIVRAGAVAAPRDVAVARPAPMETLPRAIPLPDNGNDAWPLQPEAMTPSPPPPAARPAPRFEPKIEPKIETMADEPPAWPLQPQAETPPPPSRPPRDTLAALADELSMRPTPPSPAPPPPPPLPPARNRPAGAPRGLEPRSLEPRSLEPRSLEPRSLEPRSLEPRSLESRSLEPRAEREPRPEPRAEPRIPAPPQAPAAADTAAADQSLAEMAHRLEAALRKPNAPPEARTPAPPRAAPAADQAAAPEPPALAPPPPPMSRAARPLAEPKQPPQRGNAPATKPAQSGTLYDNLEQEMASLLGRPTNKN